jgi:hypothetical protein
MKKIFRYFFFGERRKRNKKINILKMDAKKSKEKRDRKEERKSIEERRECDIQTRVHQH